MAPRNASEFERILRPDGRLIVVTPGDGHLRELADKLMAEPSDQSEKAETLTQQLTPTLTRQTTESVRTSFTADQQTIQRLVTMTPLRWKSQKRVVSGLADIERLDITASFTLMTFSLTT
jgi:tRNA G46 methylase TrmB